MSKARQRSGLRLHGYLRRSGSRGPAARPPAAPARAKAKLWLQAALQPATLPVRRSWRASASSPAPVRAPVRRRLRTAAAGERERIEVALLLRCDPDAEVNVRAATSGSPLGPIVPTARPRRPPRPSRRSSVPRCVSVTAQPVRGLNGEAVPEDGTVPAKVTVPDAGATHGAACIAADVDAAMLAGGIRMRRVEDERLQHGAVGGPRPRAVRPARRATTRGSRAEQRRDARPPPLSTATDGPGAAIPAARRLLRSDAVVRRTGRSHGRGGGRRCQTRLQNCHRVPR